jgi:hypothetical protein
MTSMSPNNTRRKHQRDNPDLQFHDSGTNPFLYLVRKCKDHPNSSNLLKKGAATKDLLKCAGTLKVIFWRDRQHTFPIMNAYTCMMDGDLSDGKEKDRMLPMIVLAPSLHWNFTEQHLLEMKSALVRLKDACWSNLQGCVSERQYL